MTRGELFNAAYQGFGGAPRLFSPAPSMYDARWIGNPSADLGSLPVTADDQVLAQNWQIQNLARQANMLSQANTGKQKLNLLRRAVANPYSIDLSRPPETQDEANLQQIVQEDINARERGARYGVAGEQRKAREAQQARNNALTLRRLALQEASAAGRLGQGDVRLGQGQQRINLAQQGQQERFSQNDLKAMQQDYADATAMIDQGVPLSDIIADNPDLSPMLRGRLYSYASAVLNQDKQSYGAANAEAESLNAQIADAEQTGMDKYAKSLQGTFYNSSPDPEAEQRFIDREVKKVEDAFAKDKNRNKYLIYDPNYDPDIDAGPFRPRSDNPLSTPGAKSIADYGRSANRVIQSRQPRPAPGRGAGVPQSYRNFQTYGVIPRQSAAPMGLNRANLPVVNSQRDLAMLNYGDWFVGPDGMPHQNLPKGIMFGR